MLLHVPGSLDGLLSPARSVFPATDVSDVPLLLGQVSQTGSRTVCGMLVGARLSDVWEHSRAHRFFSQARWSPDELGVRIAVLIAERLSDPDSRLTVAIDDTLLQRWGRRVWGCFYHHDATANSDRSAVAWGNNWVVVGIVMRVAIVDRPVCLTVLFRLWRPRRKQIPKGQPDPERPSKPLLARELVDLLAARLPDRRIDVVGDAAYAANAWRGVGPRVTVTSRLRSDAAIYARTPPPTGQRGRPRKWGARLPGLAQIALDPATQWITETVRRYGKSETLTLCVLDCLWEPLGPDTPVRVILLKDDTKPSGYQLALITTDLDSTPAAIVQRYSERWAIEVCFEEAKHQAGVGDAQNRIQPAVQRTVPFQFLTMTITITWYALHGHHPDDIAERRARSPWYLSKTNPSFSDMLAKLRRTIIAGQYSPGRLRAPYQQKITAIQQAWAAMIP